MDGSSNPGLKVPWKKSENAKYNVDNSEDGLGTTHAYFEKGKKGEKLLEVLSKSSS